MRSPRRDLGPILFALAFASVASVASTARAESPAPTVPLGRAGEVIVSASRLAPIVAVTSRSVEAPATDGHTGTRVVAGSDPNGTHAYTLPRIGFDWLPLRGLTLGTDFAGYATFGGAPSLGQDPQVSLFGVTPRVGWLATLDPKRVFVWLRGGPAYYVMQEDGVNGGAGGITRYEYTWKQLDLDVEAHLVFSPFSHLGVTCGFAAEVPLAGTFDEQRAGSMQAATHASASWLHIGLTAGLLAYL